MEFSLSEDLASPSTVTVAGGATAADGSALKFTQSFVFGPREAGSRYMADKAPDVSAVIERCAILRTRLMIGQ